MALCRDGAAKAELRYQAIEWLKAELKNWGRLSIIAEPGNTELLAKTPAHRTEDPDLASVRVDAGLAKLP